MPGYMSEPLIRRLPVYNRYLRALEEEGVQQISSQELGERMRMTPSQIRQDINTLGGEGRQGYGYQVHSLREHIRKIIGLDRTHRMVIIGAGRIGRAIASYEEFTEEGFETAALFDADTQRVAAPFERAPVYPMEELKNRLPGLNADIGVLALPAQAAQDALDQLYEAGVRSIWNFAPVDLHYPEDMAVVNVHLSDSLQILTYKMNHRISDRR